VDNEQENNPAVQIARSVPGVRKVMDDLIVKTAAQG
jgi:osmotically-inducible protein OsmY